jgi:hypothetical protein
MHYDLLVKTLSISDGLQGDTRCEDHFAARGGDVVHLVSLVCLVSLVHDQPTEQRNKLDKPNKRAVNR